MGIVILVVVCLVFLVLTQSNPIDVKNLKHVEVIQTIDLYMRQLAAAAVNKLQAMTDSEFSEREFILTDEE